MADKSAGELVAAEAKRSRDLYRASQPNLRTEAEAQADADKAAKGKLDDPGQKKDLPTGARSHP